MPLKSNLKKLPSKKTVSQTAKNIKTETVKKTESKSLAKKDQNANNIIARRQINSSEKGNYSNSNRTKGKTSVQKDKVNKKTFKKSAKEQGLYHSNPNANAYSTMHKSMYNGSINTGNERRRAFTNKELREVQQEAFANTVGGRFLANTAESLIDNSVIAAPYTFATGKKPTQTDFFRGQPESEMTDEQRQRTAEREERMHTGIAAGAGQMAGMAINYGMARSALNPALDKATDAVINGTKIGQAIKGSSVLGKIGQSVGRSTAQDIGRGLVKESISDATLGFGQNALINYGEGLRGEDFWKQQAKDTALDFLVGGAMEGVGIGSQIRGIGRDAKAIAGQSATDTLADAASKKEYLDTLLDRMKGLDDTRFGDRSDIPKLKNASEAKADEFMQEYQNVSRMSNKRFKGYQNGEFVYDSAVKRSELLAEARRRGFEVSDKTTTKELKEILGINRNTAEEAAEAYTKAKRPKKGINKKAKEEYNGRRNRTEEPKQEYTVESEPIRTEEPRQEYPVNGQRENNPQRANTDVQYRQNERNHWNEVENEAKRLADSIPQNPTHHDYYDLAQQFKQKAKADGYAKASDSPYWNYYQKYYEKGDELFEKHLDERKRASKAIESEPIRTEEPRPESSNAATQKGLQDDDFYSFDSAKKSEEPIASNIKEKPAATTAESNPTVAKTEESPAPQPTKEAPSAESAKPKEIKNKPEWLKLTPDKLHGRNINEVVHRWAWEFEEGGRKGTFTPKEVSEWTGKSEQEIRRIVFKDKNLTIDKSGNINAKDISRKSAYLNNLVEQRGRSSSANSIAKIDAKTAKIKDMDLLEFEAFEDNELKKQISHKRGIGALSFEKAQEIGLVGKDEKPRKLAPYEPPKLTELKTYKEGVNNLKVKMENLRELVDDFQSRGLLEKVTDKISYDTRKNPPLTVENISQITKFPKQQIESLLAKNGITDSTKLTMPEISKMTGIDTHTLNKARKGMRMQTKYKSVNPDSFNPQIAADILGSSEENIRRYVKNSEDLYIDGYGNIRRNPEKEAKFKEGFLEKLRAENAEAKSKAEAQAKMDAELEANAYPYGESADYVDEEAILRELREGGGTTKPTEVASKPAEVKPAEATRQELPNREQQKAQAAKEDDILDYYTRDELKKILKANGGGDLTGVKGTDIKDALREKGITKGDFAPSGRSVKGELPQELREKYFPNEPKAKGELPQGENVTARASSETKGEPLETRVQKETRQYEEAVAKKRDWRTLNMRPMQKYASHVGVADVHYYKNKAELQKAIEDIESGKVKPVWERPSLDEVKANYEKNLGKDFRTDKGVYVENIAKEANATRPEIKKWAQGNDDLYYDRVSDKVFWKKTEEPLNSEVKTYKVEADTPKADIPAETKAVENTKPATRADLSQDEEDWLELHGNKIDKYFNNLSGFSKTTYEKGRTSIEDVAREVGYKGSPESFRRICDVKGYYTENIAKNGEINDFRFKPPNAKAADVTTTTANAPSSKTSSYDTTFADYKGGTYTITASDALPKKGEPNFVRRGGAKAKQKVKGELPKGQKVSGNPKKKLELNSKFKDVIERFKGTDARDALDEAGEAIKKFRGSDTSKTWETYLNSEDIAPETKRLIIKRRETNQGYIKEVLTDEKVVAQAKKNIEDDFEGTVSALTHKIQNGERFTKQDNADLLMAAQHYDEIGEFRKADELYAMSQPEITNAAQVLAFQRWHYKTTPAGRAYSAITVARKIAKENNAKNIKINDKLIEAIYNAKTESDITKAMDAFKLDVWNQIPPSFAEKANAWRYLAMLGNPKTHIRNHLGNALFIPARVISDSFATVVERGLSKRLKSLGGNSGNHAILNRLNADDRALIKAGAESFKEHHAALASASSKYFDMARPFDSPVFTGKHLNWLSKKNTDLLEGADKMYMGITYRSAYAQYMKAHGIKASQITSEIAEKASKYAENEALKATYRDPNQLASALSKFRRNLKPTSKDSGLVAAGKTATGFLMDSTVPFVKTPLNILKRGTLEYSPVGVARGIYDIVRAQDADQLLKGIGYFANGLTGTGVLALGFYLGNKGFVNGSLGDYNKKVAYDETLGAQDYALNIGDTSITLDWVAPMSMPFFVGVEAGANTDTGGDVWTFIDALSNMTNPVFEMSMLQGIENTFNTAMQGEKGIATIAKNAAFNYASQYVPTLSGQFTRTFVNQNRKTALSTATNPLQREVEKQLGKIINKTPLSNGLSQDYVDQWGRVEANDNKGLSALENFFSPAYISKKNVTPVDTEIQRLYEKLDEENKDSIIPTVNTNAFKQEFDGKEYVMTPAEFTQYKRTVGQAKYNGLDKLFKTTAYKNASDDEKRKMIQNVYDEANLQGKKEYLTKVSKEYASAPDFYALDSSQREKYDETLDISKQKWATAYNSLTSTYNEVKRNSGESLTTAEKAFILASNGITTLEQAQTFNKNINEKTWERALNAKKNGKTIEQVMKEAEARKDMTESEKEFDSRFRTRADDRRSSNAKRVVSDDLYSKALKAFQSADKENDDNGTVKQEEAINAIEYLTQAYGLSREQQACLWYLAQSDEGWKKTPYGKWKG